MVSIPLDLEHRAARGLTPCCVLLRAVEYAKSNRAACKGCKNKIEKGALRIGTTIVMDYAMTSWKHLECFKRPGSLQDLDEITDIQTLKPEDQARVNEWWANPSAFADKAKADRMAQAVADARAEPVPPATPPSKKQKTSAAPKSTPEKAAVEGEVAKRKDYEAKFGALPIESLKNCLRANEQLLSGNKGDLVERCVDRKLYGNLPRCTKCGLGRLRVSYPSLLGHGGQGTFTCPGGYDDDEFVRCGFRSSNVTRPPWVETEHETYTKPPRKSGGGKSAGAGQAAASSNAAPAPGSSSATPAPASSSAAPAPAASGACIVVD